MTDRLEERMRLAAHGNGGPGIQDDVLDEVERALSKVAGAISAAFNAGMEERENAWRRRQSRKSATLSAP